MKYIIVWIALLSCYTTFGQTAAEYYERGEQEERKNNFEAAINAYSKAIEIDSPFIDAYYLRAKLYYNTGQYQATVADLDKAIALQPGILDLLKLRGESYLKIKDKENACKDFIEASKSGADIEEAYLKLCGYQRIKNEAVYLDLPDKKNWKIQEESIKNNQKIVLLVNKKKAEYLSLTSGSGIKNSDLIQMMDDAYSKEKGKSKDTKFSLIDKDLKAKEPWVMYVIQNLSNEARNREETQVWLLIQGDNCLHTCVLFMKNNSFTNEQQEAIIRFFKTAKIMYD